MQSFYLSVAVLISTVVLSEALFFDGGLTLGGGAALLGLFALKGVAIGGLALGAAASRGRGGSRRGGGRSRYSSRGSRRGHSSRRYGRSVESTTDALLEASVADADDCAKMLVCSLSSRDFATLAEDEAAIAILFGKGELDVTKVSVEFDLAAHMGRKAGEDHCRVVYSRCPYNAMDLMEVVRQPSYYNEI